MYGAEFQDQRDVEVRADSQFAAAASFASPLVKPQASQEDPLTVI